MADQNGESHQNGNHETFIIFFEDLRLVCKLDALGREILGIAIPAILTLAADPVASLIDTIFIGRLGAVEIGAVGVAIAIFNQASRITMYPIVSITTSFVAEEHSSEKMSIELAQKVEANRLNNLDLEASATSNHVNETTSESTLQNASKTPSMQVNAAATPIKVKRKIPSATTAIIMGTLLGVAQALLLMFGAKVLLRFMGVKTDSPMYIPARQYLTIRALGSPAVLLSLAMQGVFRGFKDTTTPLYATVVGDAMNVVMDPIFIFIMRLGVRGAAISHALSQYLIALILFLRLMQQVNLLAPSVKELQFGRFIKTGFLMLTRVIAVTSCVTFAAGLAARQGPIPMAAFQICLQVWLTSSLLADGLAVSGQAILAYAFTEKDHKKAITTAIRVAQMGVVVGLGLLVIVGGGLYFGAGVFTKDKNVLHLMYLGIPFIAGTQPINTLAFVLDGVNFGASDFAYTAYSMIIMAIASITSEYLLAKARGYIGIWYALIIYMGLRTVAGVWRVGTATGPWRFLRGRMLS
ncbi:protein DETOXIFICATION 43-like isoform X1 [Juglans microcarpa x Juglans regia]|uniref:protein DETOXIFICATION 43-like isoform X1 n=1 Tax=Juglans microcarpa x Juglans regia TaxID=2249226 RepID=UPI001B7F6C8C|nr:protein DETOXIFICATION 43-like isoform X1 [Juglans microcarpa x Juglans regia]